MILTAVTVVTYSVFILTSLLVLWLFFGVSVSMLMGVQPPKDMNKFLIFLVLWPISIPCKGLGYCK